MPKYEVIVKQPHVTSCMLLSMKLDTADECDG